jgi:hypothetical protein
MSQFVGKTAVLPGQWMGRIQDDDRGESHDQCHRRPAIWIYIDKLVEGSGVQARNLVRIEDFDSKVRSQDTRIKSHADIPHKMRPSLGADGRPDIIIPDEQAYFDATYPREKLFVIGLKTTCKDRWRQVLNEAPKHKAKHIITLQPGISSAQLGEMHTAGVSLVVPESLHHSFPKEHTISLLSVESFIQAVKTQLSA